MSFKEDLLKARGHLVIIIAIITSLAIILRLEKYSTKNLAVNNEQKQSVKKSYSIPVVKHSILTKQEQEYAQIAWKYFENNYNTNTGMVNSVDKYTASTIWDTSSYLMALISARRLNIISSEKFDSRMSKILITLSLLPLFDNELPNKSYNTSHIKMVDYSNKDTKKGIGWSAIDLSRLIASLYTISLNYPKHDTEVKSILTKYKYNKMIKDGQFYGASIGKDKNSIYLQEGRLGYEQYSAKAFNLLGFEVNKSLDYQTNLKFIDVYSLQVPADSRDEKLGGHNYVISEPYILDGLEFGWDQHSAEFANLIYQAQEERYKKEKILTAVTEDNLDRSPYFVYNTVYSDGKVWNCIDSNGKDASKFKSISTKAVFGWNSLYGTKYTNLLMERIKDNYDPKKGWYSGIYEKDNTPNKSITCNTNAIILESLSYKQFGKLAKFYN